MITDLATVKAVCGIDSDDTSFDASIEIYIEKIEGDYLQIRNAPFQEDEEGNIIYPGEVGASEIEKSKVIAAEMIGFAMELGRFDGRGLKSEGLLDHSQNFEDKVNGYPKSMISSITSFIGVL